MWPLKSDLQPVRRQPYPWRDGVLSEEVFIAALDREFTRADRLDEAFVLLVVTPDDPSDDASWHAVIAASMAVKQPTDVIGWLEDRRSLALIRPVTALEPAAVATTIGPTLQREFAQTLGFALATACSIRFEAFCCDTDMRRPSLRSKTRHETLVDALNAASKRAFDIVGSLALLTLLAPVFLVVSALVRFSSRGPILFRQARVGFSGQPFTMLKFRTMHTDSDQSVHEQYVTQFIQAGRDAVSHAGVFKIVNDRRVTPVGHFLRRSSLDELPQFWNVLRGEMSLVGPRPPLPYEVVRYKRWHHRRLWAAKPGITGLWQVTARSRATFDDMVRLDLQYARNVSLWTDIRILLATPRAVFSGKGAH